MASVFSIGTPASFLEAFDRSIIDPTTKRTIRDPAILECGHLFDQESANKLVIQKQPCPLCEAVSSRSQKVPVMKQLIEERMRISLLPKTASEESTKEKALVDSRESRTRKKTKTPDLSASGRSRTASTASSKLNASSALPPSVLASSELISLSIASRRRSSLPNPIPSTAWQEGRPRDNLPPDETIVAGDKVGAALSSRKREQLKSHFDFTDDRLLSCYWRLKGQTIDFSLLVTGLNGSPHVIDLDLRALQNRIDANSLARILATNTSLTRLDLSHNQLGIGGMQAIGEALLKNPRLSLQQLQLVDICTPHSSEKPQLASLDEGMKNFCEWLSVTRSLTKLNLSKNIFDVRLLAEALRKNAQLRLSELDLTEVPVPPKDSGVLPDLMGNLKSLRKLAICLRRIEITQDRSLLSKKDEERYAAAQRDAQTRGNNNYPVPVRGRDEAKNLRSDFILKDYRPIEIEIFTGLQQKIFDQMLGPLEKLDCSLTDLSLAGSEIGDYGAILLAKWLESNTTLQKLNLAATQLHGPGVRALASALSKNQKLPLEILDLGDNVYYLQDPQSYSGIANADSSKTETLASALSAWLTGSISLKKLNLRHSKGYLAKLKQQYVEKILNENKRWVDITPERSVLKLREWGWSEEEKNRLTKQAEKDFDLLLLTKDTLEIIFLAQALRQNKGIPLEELNLEGMKMGLEAAESLAKWLGENTSLKILNLNATALGPEGIKVIVNALLQNSHLPLSELNLKGLRIGPEGGNDLSRWLRVNTTLKKLNLKGTALGLEGTKAIARALEGNRKIPLAELNLQGNALDTDARFTLVAALPRSVRLLTD